MHPTLILLCYFKIFLWKSVCLHSRTLKLKYTSNYDIVLVFFMVNYLSALLIYHQHFLLHFLFIYISGISVIHTIVLQYIQPDSPSFTSFRFISFSVSGTKFCWAFPHTLSLWFICLYFSVLTISSGSSHSVIVLWQDSYDLASRLQGEIQLLLFISEYCSLENI